MTYTVCEKRHNREKKEHKTSGILDQDREWLLEVDLEVKIP